MGTESEGWSAVLTALRTAWADGGADGVLAADLAVDEAALHRAEEPQATELAGWRALQLGDLTGAAAAWHRAAQRYRALGLTLLARALEEQVGTLGVSAVSRPPHLEHALAPLATRLALTALELALLERALVGSLRVGDLAHAARGQGGPNAGRQVAEALRPEGRLRYLRLVHLSAPPNQPHAPRAEHRVDADERLRAFCDGRSEWPGGLEHALTWTAQPDVLFADVLGPLLQRIEAGCARAKDAGTPMTLAVCTPSLGSTRLLAEAVAGRRGVGLVCLGAAVLGRDPPALANALRLAAREALLTGAVLLVHNDHRGWAEADETAITLSVLRRVGELVPLQVLVDCGPRGDTAIREHAAHLVEVSWPAPGLDAQLGLWKEALAHAGVDHDLRTPIVDMPLDADQILRLAELAARQSRLMEPGTGTAGAPALVARVVSDRRAEALRGIASRVRTTLEWSDVILPDATLTDLMEIVTYARYREHVFDTWGFGQKVPYGRSNSSLFTGEPGTGKTMVAALIARELGMEVFRVDTSQIMSKWVGETEKNLAKVFDEATRTNALLLFDEADSLLGKRTGVSSSNDRYSNLEVNYLLQRIESFDGVTVMTTNLADNIDPAFLRRIRFHVLFPFPDEDARSRLWRVFLPSRAAVEPDLDFARLGRRFELSGGSIKNAVLRAAFQAAEAGGSISMAHLATAGAQEARSMGRLVRS